MAKTKGLGMIIGAILIGFFVLGGAIGGVLLYTSQSTTETQVTQTETILNEGFCSNNALVNSNIQSLDELAATLTSMNVTYYLVRTDTSEPVITTLAVTTSGTNFVSGTDSFTCGGEYKIYSQTGQDDENGILITELTSEDTTTDPVNIPAKVPDFGTLKTRVYDKTNNNYLWANSSTSITQYSELRASYVNFTSITDNNTSTTVGTDGQITFEIEVETNTSAKQFGSNSYLAFDYLSETDPNDWQEPIVKVNGVALSNVKSSLSANDQLGLPGYETVYLLPESITATPMYISVTMIAASGVNPDYNPSWKFVASGVYIDDKDASNLLVDALFRNDAARTEIATATAQLSTFQII